MSISDDEIRAVLIWEENWFRRASMGELVRREGRETFVSEVSRFIAKRIVRHAVWYLRSRHRDKNDLKAAWVLLKCLREIGR